MSTNDSSLSARVLSSLSCLGLIHEEMSPAPDLLDEIRRASVDELCGGAGRDASSGEMVRAGLLLAAGGLEDAHRIVQRFETPEACYWHGIVHRREPDWANAKYWFRRVGPHPVFEELSAPGLRAMVPDAAAFDRITRRGRWDPLVFVDLCQACVSGEAPGLRRELEALQREEIVRLLRYGLCRVTT